MLDGVYLEAAGVPTAVICTEPFVESARLYSANNGFPGYRFGVVPHPIANLDDAGFERLAGQSLPQVLAILRRE